MNALTLAEYLERHTHIAAMHDECANKLRRQHEVIVKLREALEGSVAYAEFLEKTTYRLPDASQIKSKQALKETEDLK